MTESPAIEIPATKVSDRGSASGSADSLAADVDRWWRRLDPEVSARPWNVFARLREEAPVYRHPSGVAAFGDVVFVSRFADITSVLADSATFSNADPRNIDDIRSDDPEKDRRLAWLREFHRFHHRQMSSYDDPDHARLRSLAHRTFTPRTVSESAQQIEGIVDSLLDEVAANDDFDIMEDFAWKLPMHVIAGMLDISRDDCERIRLWSEDIGALLGARFVLDNNDLIEPGYESMMALEAFLIEVLGDRNPSATTNLMSALVQAYRSGDELVQRDIVAMTYQVLFAGHETTARLVASGTHSLLTHRDQWDLLGERPDLISSAVEELLRYESPTLGLSRYVTQPTVLAGVELQPGDWIRALIASGNHDPAQYSSPEQLDVTRRGFRHLALGFGPHLCLGAALARMEATKAFERLTARFPDLTIADPASVTFNSSMAFRGISTARMAPRAAGRAEARRIQSNRKAQ